MKSIKMSLAAALLVSTSAFAVDNVEFSGDLNIFYHTSDAGGSNVGTTDALAGNTNGSLFSKNSSAADASLNLNVAADLVEKDGIKVGGGLGYSMISTLGLENNFVSNVWGSSHRAVTGTGADYAGAAHGNALGGAKVENASWLNEGYVTVSAGKTTAKLGRMALDTPLAFTETWSIEKNTFEGAAIINTDIPDTTVVAAYVGNGNGNETFGQDLTSNVAGLSLAFGGVVNADGKFGTFGTDGAYAAGIINNTIKPLTVQAWYYDVSELATAYWLQADVAMDGILAGAQYTSTDVDGAGKTFLGLSDKAAKASGTFALMAGYEMKDTATVKLAYSQTSDKGALHGANVATGTGASKLYTEAWWTYGQVTKADTSAITLIVESPVNGIVDLGLYATMTDTDQKDAAGLPVDQTEMTEVTITAGKEFGPLAATLAYIYTDLDDKDATTTGDDTTAIQAFLTLSF
ncbi:hypothetical protein [Sulfurimonas sp.]|uniref:hypothetical protein n=1 Tax=Sulfurimonas sp. TaxID=2022749 RepID=UPI003567C30D